MAVRAALVPSHDARGALLKAVADLQYGYTGMHVRCVYVVRLYSRTQNTRRLSKCKSLI